MRSAFSTVWGVVTIQLITSLGVACGPDLQGPLTVGVLGPSAVSGSYAIVPTRLDTLESLRRLRGPGVEVRSGARMVFDYDVLDEKIRAGEIQSFDDIRTEVLRREGKPPSAMFSRGSLQGEPGVWLAEDFDTLGMATAYAHVARARAAALEAGMPEACLRRLPLYYDVTFIERGGGASNKQADNAFFMPLMGAIFFLPYEAFPTLSMAMNQGIIAHEYSHAIWACLVEDFLPFDRRALSLDGPSARLLSAFNEGLADYFGARVTADPGFLAITIPEQSARRDTDVVRLFTQAIANDATDGGGYDPYALGAVLASALWRVRRDRTDPGEVDRLVIETLLQLPSRLDAAIASTGVFGLGDFLALLVTAADAEGPTLRGPLCRTLAERFALGGAISGCP